MKREQKEAIGLLQIGTFLEYFDLLLYVHMAVLLNELFFPKTDPHTAALLSGFAFCTTYILRPFGALIFGYIGDNIGRKTTVIITTMMMSMSCVIMANLPTYAEIGITATWVVTICRMVQGMSSMGEIMGAEIYITEMTKPPVQYPLVASIGVASCVGATAALGVASLVTIIEFNWRIAFWIGACIAVIGSVARTRLRETPEFVDMKRKIQKDIYEKSLAGSIPETKTNAISQYIARRKQEKINKKTLSACFLIQCGWPLSFYLAYMYFNPLLKTWCGYSVNDIIIHNFFLSIVILTSETIWAKLSYRIYPLKILKERLKAFSFLIILLPFILLYNLNHYQIFALQSFLLIVCLYSGTGDAIMIKALPVFKRFTTTSFMYALSRALVYIITSLGLVYITESMGHYGIWIVALPICIGFLWGVNYFEKLENKKQTQVYTPHSTNHSELKLAG